MLGYLILFVLFIICLFYAFSSHPSSSNILDKSNGTFDESAKSALNVINTTKNPTAEDLINRGDITRFNINDDNVTDVTTLANIADDYVNGATQTTNADLQDVAANRLRTLTDYDQLVALFGRDDMNIANMLQQNHVNANVINKTAAKSRMDIARAKHATRGDAARAYMHTTATIANDRQNVHDRMVNRDLNNALRIMMTNNRNASTASNAITAARDMLTSDQWRRENPDIDVQKALQTLDIIAAGNIITTFSTTEDKVFATVWDRASHPDNANNVKQIRTAIATALVDGIENGKPVCANGRCSRIIGSLATLDANPQVGITGTTDMYKAKIIGESTRIMDNELQKLRVTTPADVTAWESGADTPAAKAISGQLATAINANIDTYVTTIPAEQLNVIRSACVQAVD